MMSLRDKLLVHFQNTPVAAPTFDSPFARFRPASCVISRPSMFETPYHCGDGLRAIDNLASTGGWHRRTARSATDRERREEFGLSKATPQYPRGFSGMREGSRPT